MRMPNAVAVAVAVAAEEAEALAAAVEDAVAASPAAVLPLPEAYAVATLPCSSSQFVVNGIRITSAARSGTPEVISTATSSMW